MTGHKWTWARTIVKSVYRFNYCNFLVVIIIIIEKDKSTKKGHFNFQGNSRAKISTAFDISFLCAKPRNPSTYQPPLTRRYPNSAVSATCRRKKLYKEQFSESFTQLLLHFETDKNAQ